VLGIAVAALLSLILFIVPKPGLFVFPFLLVWPTEILMVGDMPVAMPDVILLGAISAVANGLVYAILGALVHLGTKWFE
jgi:hypothetical protein